jgi:hypothetical protein
MLATRTTTARTAASWTASTMTSYVASVDVSVEAISPDTGG